MNDIETIRRRVKATIERRRKAGETLEQIGDSLGVHWTTVWKWQRGQLMIRPGIAALFALATAPDDQIAA